MLGDEMAEAHPFQDLSDQAWECLRPLLPGEAGTRGQPAQDNRRFLNAVFWILRTGAPWRHLPPEYGGWKNTHRRFCRWRDRGVWGRILDSVTDTPGLEWPTASIASRLRACLHEDGGTAGHQAVALTSRHLPDSPPGSLDREASATPPGPSEVQTMGDGAVGKECPRCGGTDVKKDGRRGGWQQFRCRSGKCGYRFNDSANAFKQRFPAEVIAKAIDRRLKGLTYKDISAKAGSTTGVKIPEATVLRWVEKYLSFAVEEARKLIEYKWRVTLGIEYAPLHSLDGGCWLAQDLNTGYVLAVLLGTFDPDTAREVITMAIGPEPHYEDDVYNFTFQTDEETRRSGGFRNVQAAIRQRLRYIHPVPPENYAPDDFLTIGPQCAFRTPLQFMSERKAFRSPRSRRLFLDGWVVRHNFFVREGRRDVPVPADEAGLEAPFRSWLDVVNCRVKAPAGDRSS